MKVGDSGIEAREAACLGQVGGFDETSRGVVTGCRATNWKRDGSRRAERFIGRPR